MATAAQLIANRENATHSTGPRTPEGKARSASNALRHGLTATRLIVRDEEREEFETLRTDLLEELAPEGPIEVLTFNELLHAAWNLHRFRRLEAERGASPDALDDPAAAAVLDRLTRYQSRAQRAYYRALQELRTLQTNRALRTLKLGEAERAEVPRIADINEYAKQTRSEVTDKAMDVAIRMINYETGIRLVKTHELVRRQAGPDAPARS